MCFFVEKRTLVPINTISFKLKLLLENQTVYLKRKTTSLMGTLHTLQHIFMFKTLLRVLKEIVHL